MEMDYPDDYAALPSMRPLAHYDERRRTAIEGVVETPEQTAERERKERAQHIKKQRKHHTDRCRDKLRELDKARRDRKLAKIGAVASGVALPGVVIGWVLATVWGAATSFGGGRGGPLTFYMIMLIIFSITEVVCLISSGCALYNKYEEVTKATHAYHDALDESAEFEASLDDTDGVIAIKGN